MGHTPIRRLAALVTLTCACDGSSGDAADADISPDGAQGSPDAIADVMTNEGATEGGTPPNTYWATHGDPDTSKGFHVMTTGSSKGDGSLGNPWDLATALAGPKVVQPGDTIWVHGGTYAGQFSGTLSGATGLPVIVRAVPADRVTLQSTAGTTLAIKGAWAWYWGLEVTQTFTSRVSAQTGSSPSDICCYSGIDVSGDHVMAINDVVHDSMNGLSFFSASTSSEVYGNVVVYTGWDAPDRGHGHAIYTQNQDGMGTGKLITDNILAGSFDIGFHAYGSPAAYLDNFTVEGNVAFSNGISSHGLTDNMILGGGRVANNPSVLSNYTWQPPSAGGENQFCYGSGCNGALIRGNYLVGTIANHYSGASTGLVADGNTFVGTANGALNSAAFPSNTYLSMQPTTTQVFVRPNYYDRGRAHVIVYNFGGDADVTVDLSATGLKVGETYAIRFAMDPLGKATTGKYDGSAVHIPLTGWAPAPAEAWSMVPATLPAFGVFIVSLQ